MGYSQCEQLVRSRAPWTPGKFEITNRTLPQTQIWAICFPREGASDAKPFETKGKLFSREVDLKHSPARRF